MPIAYTWFHSSGRQLFTDQRRVFVNQGQLSFSSVEKGDLGLYRCVASNAYGSAEVNFTLNVLCMFDRARSTRLSCSLVVDGPVIVRTQGYPKSGAVMPGTSATLLCVVDANPLELNKLRWFKDAEELLLTNRDAQWERRIEGNEASLIARSVRREDAAQYACEIDNALGNSRATVPLSVQCQ